MIDEDELMTTEHNTIFQVSDIVTATEHSDLKNSNADYGNGDNENGDKENDDQMLTHCSRSVTLGSQVGLSCFIGKCASPKSLANYPTKSFLNVSRRRSTGLEKFPKKTFLGLLLLVKNKLNKTRGKLCRSL